MDITRRTLLGGVTATLLGYAQSRPKYNVLMIPVDDLRPELGCYGHTTIKTPNIDRLAAKGTVFLRAYTQQAVCSPSRTCLLTGRRPDTTRIYELQTHFRKNLPDVVTLPQHFKNNGYATTAFGKIYHNGGFPPFGLTDPESWSVAPWTNGSGEWNTPANEARYQKWKTELKEAGWAWKRTATAAGSRGPAWDAPDVPDNALPDGKAAEGAIRALNEFKDKPFFIAVGFLKPHLPFVAPKKYFDMYPPESIELDPNPDPPKDVPPVALHPSGELRAYRDIVAKGPIDAAKARELIRAYRASTTYMDAQVGRVLAELDRLGLAKNTVVILWGDHGYHLGDHGLWNKHTNFEKATHCPLIVHVPGQKPGKTHALTEFVDVYPSLAEICGLPKPAGVEGTSFRPLIDKPDRKWKKAAFSQYPRPVPGVGQAMGYSMRTERYRYTEWSVPGKDFRAAELYDYELDPLEKVNAAADPKRSGLVKELSEALRAGWQKAGPS